MWRCRHAVIVGDPQQLEPITTIPFKVEQAIRAHYGVEEERPTGRGSVSRASPTASTTSEHDAAGSRTAGLGRGAPLTVHRRCDQPMFELSNAIAYNDGLMIDATDPTLGEDFATGFSHPPAKQVDRRQLRCLPGNWIPAEGDEVDRILAHLKEIGFDFKQVMAIGPFRDVARRLQDRVRNYRDLKGRDDPHRAGQRGRHRDPRTWFRPGPRGSAILGRE